MNEIQFIQKLKDSINKKLVEKLGEESFNTKVSFDERKSHAYSFYIIAINSITKSLSIPPVGYRIKDSDEFRGFNVKSERDRLLKDIDETEDILNFIVHTFYWCS